MTDITTYIKPVALMACLVVGYCLKHIVTNERVNDWIPTIMACLGCALTLWAAGPTLENGVAGAVTGLASTGLHQAFKRAIDGLDKDRQSD